MIDEEQIIKDIVDNVYGFDSLTEKNNSKKLKLNEEERQKKCDEVLKQINSLCTRIEKELGKAIDTSTPEMSSTIRFTVFTSIRAEISNKNNVLDANGKIDVGKFLDIVIKSKDEILGKTDADTTKNQNEYSELEEEPKTNGSKEAKENIKDDFLYALADLGVEITDDDIDVIRRARKAVNEFENKVQEKIYSGMSEDEAVKAVYETMSYEERVELEWQYALVEVEDSVARRRKEETSQHKEETNGISVAKTPEIEAPIETPIEQSVGKPQKAIFLSNKATNIQPGMDGSTSKAPAYHIGYAKRIQQLNMENEDSKMLNPANLDRTGAGASCVDSIMEIQSLVMKFISNESVMSYLRTSNDDIPFVEYVNTAQKHDYGFYIGDISYDGGEVQLETNQVIQLEDDSSEARIYFQDKERLKKGVTDAFSPLIKDSEMRELWERTGEQLKILTYEETIKKYGEVVEEQGTIFSTGVSPKSSTIEVPDGTVIGTEMPPTTPPTGDPAEKLEDSPHPEIPKVQKLVAVPEEIVVGEFEPKVPQIPETTDKKAKGNDDAVTVKSEENIPISTVKAFVGTVATVRNAADATEKLQVNGERGTSKYGTNNPSGNTPDIEEGTKTEEVQEEPQ